MQPHLTWLFNQIHKTQKIDISQKNKNRIVSHQQKAKHTQNYIWNIPIPITQLRNKKSYLFASFPVLKRVFVYYVWLRVIAARRKAYSIVVRWWAQLLRKRNAVAWCQQSGNHVGVTAWITWIACFSSECRKVCWAISITWSCWKGYFLLYTMVNYHQTPVFVGPCFCHHQLSRDPYILASHTKSLMCISPKQWQ